jgi:hypothetical protein
MMKLDISKASDSVMAIPFGCTAVTVLPMDGATCFVRFPSL